MINTIQINNFMKTRRRSIRRNEVIDINQIISEINENTNSISRKSPEPRDSINYNLLYNENSKDNVDIEDGKVFELSSFLNDEKICRICYEGEKHNNELIHPCLCKGTQKYIHIKCIQEWRHVNLNNPEKRDYCEICKYHYAIKEKKDYLKFIIPNDVVINTLYFIFFILISTFVWLFDYYLDFIFLKIMTFFTHEKSILYIKFKKTQDIRNTVYDPSIDIYVYSCYIADITLFFMLFIHQYYYRKRFSYIKKEKYYRDRIRRHKFFLYVIRFSIFYVTYLSIFENDYGLFANLVPIIFILNVFIYILYIAKHNRILRDINNNMIRDEYIYSFEENPLILHLGHL
tara:strand:+ start:1354 stop:2388 length:1035 start_codon:yes stop_codon:yes gene_type:complete